MGTTYANTLPNEPPGANGLELINSTTGQPAGFVPLSCAPQSFVYSGAGPYVVGTCYNSTGNHIVELNPTDGEILWSADPSNFFVRALGLDPADGTVFLLGGNEDSSTLAVYSIELGGDALQQIVNYSGLPWYWAAPQLSFDARSGDVLVPSSGDGLLAIDPAAHTVRANISLEGLPEAAVYDPGSDQIYVALFEPNVVQIFNAATYGLVGTLSIPNCAFDGGVCAQPNSVTSLISDPSNGDVYALSVLGLLAIDTTSDASAGFIYDYGGGFVYGAAFDPTLDAVFGSWPDSTQDIGFVTTMTYSYAQWVVQLVWLPLPAGTLAIAAGIGAIFVVIRFRGKPPATRTPRPPAPEPWRQWD